MWLLVTNKVLAKQFSISATAFTGKQLAKKIKESLENGSSDFTHSHWWIHSSEKNSLIAELLLLNTGMNQYDQL